MSKTRKMPPPQKKGKKKQNIALMATFPLGKTKLSVTLGPNAISFRTASIEKSTVKMMFSVFMTSSNSSVAL